jgi:hypothetical protein
MARRGVAGSVRAPDVGTPARPLVPASWLADGVITAGWATAAGAAAWAAAAVVALVEGAPAVVLGVGLVVVVFGGAVVVVQVRPGMVIAPIGGIQRGAGLAAEEKEAEPASRRRAVGMSAMTAFRTLCIVGDISPPVLILPARFIRDWRGTQQ